MRIDQGLIDDPLVYDIMYFSPVHIGEERSTTMLYFQTDIYRRQWPTMMADRMTAQIDLLRKVELAVVSFDTEFKLRHRAAVLQHCKMALAYLDSREARIAMKLCQAGDAATKSTEARIFQDPQADFDFLRITLLSVMACAARRVKFYETAVKSLSEAKDIITSRQSDGAGGIHPLMTALTFLNLSAVLGDIDHDEQALRWGLEALSVLYGLFSSGRYPEVLEKYFIAVACHNAALINVKLGRWEAAVELVDEGIECTKVLDDGDDNLRQQLIAIGAQAKRVPEGFLAEAVNALNGLGEDPSVWNLSFWDFSIGEIKEEIKVLKHTSTLKHLIIDYHDNDRRYPAHVEDGLLAQFVMAIVTCQSLEKLTVANIDFDPRKVWQRMKKPTFLETSWYASALNFTNILEGAHKPDIGQYQKLLQGLNCFSVKVILCLVVLGNECDGVDLSDNGLDVRGVAAFVRALRWRRRPRFARQVSTVILRHNDLDFETMCTLAKTWEAEEGSQSEEVAFLYSLEHERDPCTGVATLDVAQNPRVGSNGLEVLCKGISNFEPFKVLRADNIGLRPEGCEALAPLAKTRLELLHLSDNPIGSEGATAVCRVARQCVHLLSLQLDSCAIGLGAADGLRELLEQHPVLETLSLNHNELQSEGIVLLCIGGARSARLRTVRMAYNGGTTAEAAVAVADMMRQCQTLTELDLSGNHFELAGVRHIGGAIESSKVLTMHLEDMGLTENNVDEFLDHGSAETQDLQVMVLDKNPISDEGLAVISECLSIGLTDLSLSRCSLTQKSRATLLNLLSLSPNLRRLDLSYNDLGPTGCLDMVKWMTSSEQDSYSLRALELAGCGLGDEGFLRLVPVLGALTHLGVRENGITSGGLQAVMNSNQLMQMECLDLGGNKIGESGVHSLTERFQLEHKRSLWNPKQLTSTIDTVILSNNDISSSLAAATDAFLKIHDPLLTVVW